MKTLIPESQAARHGNIQNTTIETEQVFMFIFAMARVATCTAPVNIAVIKYCTLLVF